MKQPLARDRFKEGWIMITRPFQFAETGPIQKMSIFYAYSERPTYHEILSDAAKAEIETIENQSSLFSRKILGQSHQNFIDDSVGVVLERPSSYEEIYDGEIVQIYIGETVVRLFPDEYKILTEEKVSDYMSREGFHMVKNSELLTTLKDFLNQKHYLQSRGVTEKAAERMVSPLFRAMVYYKPYFELLEMFARNHEIFEDPFYTKVEGIKFQRIKKDKNDSKRNGNSILTYSRV